MTEDEARAWLHERFGAPAEQRLAHFVTLLLAEAAQQSLIARSTFASVWSRHIADSAQLVTLAPEEGRWLDIGSGGGLPGIVAAILRDAPMVMVEPRRKRVEFLREACTALDLRNVEIIQGQAKSYTGKAVVITARAVSALDELFAWTTQNVSRGTLYLMPRGERALSDLAMAERAWQGSFHVEQSLTDSSAGIVVAQSVRRR